MQDQHTLLAKAYNMIVTNNYLCLATSDTHGKPWVAALYYAYDKDCSFYFFSAKESRHAQQIGENTRVAFAIYDSTLKPEDADGLQVDATANQVSLTGIPHAIATYYKRRFPNDSERAKHEHVPMDFHGIALRRFYKLTPQHVYILDPNFSQVDQRVELDLEQLRGLIGNDDQTST